MFLHFLTDMRKKDVEGRQLKPSSCGMPLLKLKQRLVPRICYTRTIATGSQTSRIWAPSNVVICVQRLWNTVVKMRYLYGGFSVLLGFKL